MINIIVLWQTVYVQAAVDHLAANGYPLDPADVARLTPLGHPTINLQGRRYRTTSRPPLTGLRPLPPATDSGSCTNPRHGLYRSDPVGWLRLHLQEAFSHLPG